MINELSDKKFEYFQNILETAFFVKHPVGTVNQVCESLWE